MKSNKTIKHQYAYNSKNEIVDISAVKSQENFTCISCGNIMIAKRGQINAHHFAHKVLTPACSFETYLHKLAKQIFFREYKYCLEKKEPFYIDYKLEKICIDIFNQFNDRHKYIFNEAKEKTCPNIISHRKYDLTNKFKRVFLEKKDGDFIPDVLLETKDGEKIYVEIYVSHKSEIPKIKFKNRIIEIKITSEEDLSPILGHYLSNQIDSINFFNFKTQQENNLCVDCNSLGHSFRVFISKKAFLENTSIKKHLEKDKILKSITFSRFILEREYGSDYYGDRAYVQEVINAYKNGVDIQDCNLCRYSGEVQFGLADVFCKFLKLYKNAQYATECKYFRISKEIFSD